MTFTAQSEVGPIRRLLLKTPAAAFGDQASIESQWRMLNYTAAPEFAKAVAEYEAFVELLTGFGIELGFVEPSSETPTGMDSIYVRDASILTDAGAILCNMGKPARNTEPEACVVGLAQLEVTVRGRVTGAGRIEGGDVAWLDPHTLVVGHGYRTNEAGIDQLRQLVDDSIDVVVVPLPHWHGQHDVFHLMSMLSPIDRDLLLVYSRLLPVPFRQLLVERGFTLVDVPDEEFESMACNVLAVAPRRCVMLEGNPVTRSRLEAAGAEVFVYRGVEISQKGQGGPTCLTRPVLREF